MIITKFQYNVLFKITTLLYVKLYKNHNELLSHLDVLSTGYRLNGHWLSS